MTIESFITKLGTSKGVERKRIWIEGARLTRNGFPRGTIYIRSWSWPQSHKVAIIHTAPALYLYAVGGTDLVNSAPYKVSGKAEHPIIDITSADVPTFFDGFDHVLVEFQAGIIRITGARK